MVKIPGLDDLKKMGSDLLDSAKTVDLSGMVDKFKTGMESVGKKDESGQTSNDGFSNLLQEMNVTLTELSAANAATAAAIKKMQYQLAAIAKMDKTTYQPKNEEDNQK